MVLTLEDGRVVMLSDSGALRYEFGTRAAP